MQERLNHPFVTDIGCVQYLAHIGSLSYIAKRARESTATSLSEVAYERDVKTVSYLVKEGHNPPFEHAVVSFRIYDLPLFVLNQILRYRTFSFSVESSRYRKRNDVRFYRPEFDTIGVERVGSIGRKIDKLNENAQQILAVFEKSEKQDIENLRELQSLGCPRELSARTLAVTMLTSVSITADLRNLLHFLEDRLSTHAQYEIYCIATAIRDMLRCVYPDLMEIAMPVEG